MNKLTFFLLVFLAPCTCCFAQDIGDEAMEMYNNAKMRDQQVLDRAKQGWWGELTETKIERIEWWRNAKFGLFVHWGVYSEPGGEWKGKKISGYSEHLMRKEKIPLKQYKEEIVVPFNPVGFNAEEWIYSAYKAGARYFIITAKHHDGFAMYNSDVTDYNIVQTSKYGKDPMRELSDACKKYGLKFGFYYSHAFDWEHPNAPGNDWDYQNPGGDLNLFGGRNWYDIHPELLNKAIGYVNEKAIPQIKELLIQYKPDILWFDTPHKLPLSENIRILEEIRKIDKNVVVNGRLARFEGGNLGDYQNTADRPVEFFPVIGDWEAIPTTNESYGYSKHDNTHKPASFFIRLLAKAASRGGNILMNIGPTGEGIIDQRDLTILHDIGTWMDINGESIYGTSASPLALQNWGVCTQKGNILYLHVFDWPEDGRLIVGGLKTVPSKTRFLADGLSKNISAMNLKDSDVLLMLPDRPVDQINTVIALEMNDTFQADSIRLLLPKSDNCFLTFDAVLHGQGFRYGDGKNDRYYIENWTKINQSVSWTFRANDAVEMNMSMRFQVDEHSGGKIKIMVAQKIFEIEIEPTVKGSEIRSVVIGKCLIPVGVQKIVIEPEQISGNNLMRLFQVNMWE